MKGEIRKLNLKPKTLDNTIVKDGLQAVSLLNNKESYYLVGGIASQSYLPTICRRPTSDIDFSIVKPLSYNDFREMVKPLEEYLGDFGYKTYFKKNSRSYCLDFENLTGEQMCLEFARRNEKCFEKNKKRLQREFDNANMKIVEERDTRYRVACPEDIAIPKLVRSIGALNRNPDFKNFIPKKGKIKSLSEDIIKEQLGGIEELRKISMENKYDQSLFDRLRFISDIYDIRILSEITGFNENYWNRAVEGFDNTLNSDSLSLIESLLPFQLFN